MLRASEHKSTTYQIQHAACMSQLTRALKVVGVVVRGYGYWEEIFPFAVGSQLDGSVFSLPFIPAARHPSLTRCAMSVILFILFLLCTPGDSSYFLWRCFYLSPVPKSRKVILSTSETPFYGISTCRRRIPVTTIVKAIEKHCFILFRDSTVLCTTVHYMSGFRE